MTKIKICGITGEDEIAALNETGVDYAGFVLYEKSKRYVTVQSYFYDMTNDEFAAFGIRNCEIRKYEFRG